jgi:hypothetical protein
MSGRIRRSAIRCATIRSNDSWSTESKKFGHRPQAPASRWRRLDGANLLPLVRAGREIRRLSSPTPTEKLYSLKRQPTERSRLIMI